MRFSATSLPDVVVIQPSVHEDPRGYFLECWNSREFSAHGLDHDFVQDNHSRSSAGTLRGLHYQIKRAQGKLVRAVRGEVFDVAVDLRRSSATFGQWVGVYLSESNNTMAWIPPGFAHGFYVLSSVADVTYKCTDYYAPEYERVLLWNDSAVGVAWPLLDDAPPLVSGKDGFGRRLSDAECYT